MHFRVPKIEVGTHKVGSTGFVIPTLDAVWLLYTWLAEHKLMVLCGPPDKDYDTLLCSSGFTWFWSEFELTITLLHVHYIKSTLVHVCKRLAIFLSKQKLKMAYGVRNVFIIFFSIACIGTCTAVLTCSTVHVCDFFVIFLLVFFYFFLYWSFFSYLPFSLPYFSLPMENDCFCKTAAQCT